MEKMQFKIEINVPVANVFEAMLGKDTFKQWTAVFNPSSDFEGSWEKGAKILFVGTDEQGKRGGMVGVIRELIPNKFVSIEYLGLIDGEKEITDGPEIVDWVGSFENYTFEESADKTIVIVDIDMNEQMKEYFAETYPKALEKLKEICEVK